MTEVHRVEDLELFRLLVEGVQDYAIFKLSNEGIVESWNVGAERLKGYRATEIIGQSFERFYTEADRLDGRPSRLLAAARADGRVEDEGWRVRKDGTRFWADVVITALYDHDGTPRGYGKVTRDLTDRRRAEEHRARRMAAERVLERVGRLQTITAALAAVTRPEQVAELLATAGLAAIGAAAGAVAFPLRDEDALQVAYVSGYGPTSVELHQRIHRDDPYTLAEAWRRNSAVFIPSRARVLTDFPRLAPLATHSQYEAWAAVPLSIERRLIGVMTMSYDEPRPFDDDERGFILAMAEVAAQAVDRAQLFETERRTRAEAEAAVHAQDEFLSIASHELRTPVAAVKATAQLAQRAIERGTFDAARIQRHLEGISRASDRLSSLVEDLLDVSRLRTGQLRLRRTVIDVVPMLEEVVERYQTHLEDQGGHQFRLCLPGQPVVLDVDTSRLEQVLDNFLSNAAKYSPSGGEIRVVVEPDVGADGEAGVRGVKIAVIDQGIGLPAGQEERIFEPFGRASNATAQQIPGLGLGLAICRKLIESHDGRVWASSPGEHRGTTVGLWLPLATAEPDSAA
jgi:PAS domain S-box-containing protein